MSGGCCSIPLWNKGGVFHQLQTTAARTGSLGPQTLFCKAQRAWSGGEALGHRGLLSALCVWDSQSSRGGKPNIPLHSLCFVFSPIRFWWGTHPLHPPGEGKTGIPPWLTSGHTFWEIPSHPIPWAHPGTVSLTPKPCPAPAGTPRLKGRVVQKPRCFWCSQNPGRARLVLPHPPPIPAPRGDPGQGEPCSCSTTN